VRILVALSGGVDSSVAAAILRRDGHEVVGATMKLWGGITDSGCCSLSDVEDARRVAGRLGIDHFVYNFTEEFEELVVTPYVEAHASGLTPNPCIECNRHLKFDAFLERGRRLGFDAVATGHHARVERVVSGPGSGVRLLRGRDAAKDQSYVLSCLTQHELAMLVLPVGELTKTEVRQLAATSGLITASKPDSQDVCFLGGAGTASRRAFLADRIQLHPGEVVDSESGEVVGHVPAVELVTVGQRRGLGVATGERRFAVTVDVPGRRVEIGPESALDSVGVTLSNRMDVHSPPGSRRMGWPSRRRGAPSRQVRPWPSIATTKSLAPGSSPGRPGSRPHERFGRVAPPVRAGSRPA
jgi:tRNA-specific 2-thiouridylase